MANDIGNIQETNPDTSGIARNNQSSELNTLQVLGTDSGRPAPKKGAEPSSLHFPPLEKPKPNDKNSEEKKGNTTVEKDNSGNLTEYRNGDYSISKHDDGDWYYNQNGSDTFVKVDGNSIKMDDKGQVTFNESGLFGKHDQVLGNGSTGVLSSVGDLVSSTIEDPLETVNTILLPQIAIIDAVADTHVMDAIEQIERGAANEVIHNPGGVAKTVAIGFGIGVLTAATGGGALAALAIGGAYFAADELIRNKGDINAVVNDVKSIGTTFKDWGEDFVTIAGNSEHSAKEIAEAEQGLQQLGAFGTHTIAGALGNIAGEAAATAVGWNRAANAAKATSTTNASADRNTLQKLLDKGIADGSVSDDVAIVQTRTPQGQHHLILPKDGVTGIEDPRVYLPDAPNYFKEALNPKFIEQAKQLDLKQSAAIFEKHGFSPAEAKDWAQFVVDKYSPAQPAVTVNSPYSRSQDLLHLHLDDIDPKVQRQLAQIAKQNGFSKTSFESIGDLIPDEAENLRAMWIPAKADGGLGGANPFKMVYDSLPANRKGSIDQHSIALVPMEYQNSNGFLIIDGQAGTNGAALEWLQHYTAWSNQGSPNL